MNEKLIKTTVLGNGLILEIYDHSCKVAGDRWLVKMAAIVDIPIDYLIKNASGNSQLDLNIDELRKFFNACIRYEQKRDRNFLSSSQAYLSHPDFPVLFAKREYLKKKQQRAWHIEESDE